MMRTCLLYSYNTVEGLGLTLVESRMVLMRCAMVSTVQCLNSRRIVRWMSESVSESTLAVASSATSTRGCRG